MVAIVAVVGGGVKILVVVGMFVVIVVTFSQLISVIV